MSALKVKLGKPEPSGRFLNRELSWLNFNHRVLEEAESVSNPLLERLKFLAIFESNLDEFFMVRVSGLWEQAAAGLSDLSGDGLTAPEQIDLVNQHATPLRQEANLTWKLRLEPELRKQGIFLYRHKKWPGGVREKLQEFFDREVFLLLTPLLLDPVPNIPFISNRSLNLAVVLKDEEGERIARVKVPDVLDRAIRISKRKHDYVLLEDLIRENVQQLFPGVQVLGSYLFRVIRDADVEIQTLESDDQVGSIEETLRKRRFGDAVLMEVEADMPAHVRKLIARQLGLTSKQVWLIDGLIGLDVLMELSRLDRPELRFRPHLPYVSDSLANSTLTFEAIRQRDVLLHHPYDSFLPVENFFASAAHDTNVIGIKATLYRVGSASPIVQSLLEAADEGKQVATMIELKARFDESNNLNWAKALERNGAHVTFGFPYLKTHAKLAFIVRKEQGHIRTYCHIGTGNYNPSTARLYSDFGLFTCDSEICQDVAELFNFLTGLSKQHRFRKLLVAPFNLRDEILHRIYREVDLARQSGRGRIVMKLNSLTDEIIINALYEASMAGVEIDLIVRGVCCLRPGVKDLSPTIKVVSIVGQFLEHSRVLYFENGSSPEVIIGSADLMRRNLDRRVEVMVPVQDQRLAGYLKAEVLERYLRDTAQAWDLDSQGTYTRRTSATRVSSQGEFILRPASRVLLG